MTKALDADQRSRLDLIVGRGRSILEADLADQAAGRFGIDPNGTIAAEDALRLDPTALAQRRDIVEAVRYLQSEGNDDPSAVARLLREAVFTHLNRLFAIRIAEAIGILPPSLAHGRRSQGFRDLLELAPTLAGDDTGGYWTYLQLCGDELAGDVPTLFDPRNPLLALTPSPGALDNLVELLADPETVELWTALDCFGWVYQFFNTNEERRAMREESAVPRDSRELAVRNQFFTPRYVVDFLVQNSLGRRLMDADPASPLLHDLPLLVDPPAEPGDPISLDEVSVLDPACGSAHFLLAAYDILERAWQHAGVGAADAAPAAVRSLWGIDIDPRCAQVAAAALIFRARRSCPEGELPRPNIICARALPETSTELDALLAGLPRNERHLVEQVTEALSDAPILGPLLKIEDRLATEVRDAAFGVSAPQDTLADALPTETLEELEADLLTRLARLADSTVATPAQRLLANDADEAIRFVQALQRRYDTVLMNPPYGAPAEGSAPYLQAAYPNSWTELYACFVERGIELTKPHGLVGALTSSQFLSTKRLQSLRELLSGPAHLDVLIDLGAGVLDGATVNTAMYVVANQRSSGNTYYSDLARLDPIARSRLALDPARPASSRIVAAFRSIPGSPFAFHLPDSVVTLWGESHRLEPDLAIVRTGGKSFDDERFVRTHWEVGASGLAAGWRRYLKGGEYQPYYAPSHLVLNWKDDGAELRGEGLRFGRLAQVMQSSRYWGEPGLCYPRASSIGFAARTMPAGEIFGEKSIAVLPKTNVESLVLLGLLNATITAEILQTFGRGRSTENGAIKSLPFGGELLDRLGDVIPIVQDLVAIFAEKERTDETSAIFIRPRSLRSADDAKSSMTSLLDRAIDSQQELDKRVRTALGASRRLDPELTSRDELLRRGLREPSLAFREWPRDVCSYLLGVAFGRWDPAKSVDSVAVPVDHLAVTPPVPPATRLCEHGLPPWECPSDASGQLPPNGVLLDQAGHRWDIEAAFENATNTVLGRDASGTLDAVLKALPAGSAREHLRKEFFKEHLARYSKSRRKAPIYWPLYIPSRRWGLWIHAPALSRETLFAISTAAADRLTASQSELRRLKRERDMGGAGRSVREVASALGLEEQLAEELRRFRDEAERIAALGWEPDLDDGIILCAAPLANLFPAWKDAAAARKEIKAGKYSWASVSKWADQL